MVQSRNITTVQKVISTLRYCFPTLVTHFPSTLKTPLVLSESASHPFFILVNNVMK